MYRLIRTKDPIDNEFCVNNSELLLFDIMCEKMLAEENNMTLEEVPDVLIDERGGDRFIVLRIAHPSGKEKRVVRANQKRVSHLGLLTEFQREELSTFLECDVTCIGGGEIRVDPDEKVIRIFGISAKYGEEPDRQKTVAILQTAYPDFKVLDFY